VGVGGGVCRGTHTQAPTAHHCPADTVQACRQGRFVGGGPALDQGTAAAHGQDNHANLRLPDENRGLPPVIHHQGTGRAGTPCSHCTLVCATPSGCAWDAWPRRLALGRGRRGDAGQGRGRQHAMQLSWLEQNVCARLGCWPRPCPPQQPAADACGWQAGFTAPTTHRRLRAQVSADWGFMCNPCLSTCQVINVSRPGEEPSDPLQVEEDMRLWEPSLTDSAGAAAGGPTGGVCGGCGDCGVSGWTDAGMSSEHSVCHVPSQSASSRPHMAAGWLLRACWSRCGRM
jgi:hypothetical protein